MRVWLDPNKLASYGLTAQDVYADLGNNNFISALGNTKGQTRAGDPHRFDQPAYRGSNSAT